MNTNRYLNLSWIVLLPLLSSCGALFSAAYGIKTPKHLDDNAIKRYASQYNIPAEASYVLDTNYLHFITSHDTSLHQQSINNHLQPLQALYYNRSGQLASFQVNCYTGGFPNLNWERNNAMAVFPPAMQAPLDSLVPLDKHINYLKPLAPSTQVQSTLYDYVVVVHWNRFMGRQSKRLIRLVQENSKRASQQSVKVVYVNTDYLFAR